jgi:iron(III) transport system ATP-binding protein
MAELAITDLALRLGETEILKGVSVTVPEGQVVAVLGPSGSGKSLLLRAIAGLERPCRGSIRIGEEVVYDAKINLALPAEARGLGLLLRSYALWPHRTVFEHVAYGLKLRRVPAEDIKTRVATMLERVDLAHCADHYPHQLSADQQQRVALARALIYEPGAILLDEPLSNLDAKLREEARGHLRHLIVSFKLSALLVTDDQTEAMAIADRIVLLNHGLIEQEGSPIDLYREPATLFAAQFMGNSNRLDGTLVENTDGRAAIEVMGVRLEGLSRTAAAVGDRATGVIRPEKVILGGGLPRANRIPMSLKAQMFTGERWEFLFAKDNLAVRLYSTASLRHDLYYIEFPPNALWIF